MEILNSLHNNVCCDDRMEKLISSMLGFTSRKNPEKFRFIQIDVQVYSDVMGRPYGINGEVQSLQFSNEQAL